jgi:hypothetical protein
MTTRSESLGQDLKAWAADQLQVAVGSAPPEVRAGYLRQTRNEFGAPNLNAREALLILTGRTCARPALALEATELQLHREMDDFASRFFSLPIAERKAEWERLYIRGRGFVRVDARLEALRPGIYIVLPKFDHDRHLGELVAEVCELFVLRPPARAARRQDRLAETHRRGNWLRWSQTADLLRNKHAAIASLEPEFIARLADADALEQKKKKLKRIMRASAEPVAGTQKPTSRWRWMIFTAAALMIVRLIAAGVSSNNPSPRFVPSPNIKAAPNFDPNELLKGKKLFIGKDGKLEFRDNPDGPRFGGEDQVPPGNAPNKKQGTP